MKYIEALKILENIKKQEDFSPEDLLKLLVIKGNILFDLERIDEGLINAERIYNSAQNLGKVKNTIRALLDRSFYLRNLGKLENAVKLTTEAEKLFDDLSDLSHEGRLKLNSALLSEKTWISLEKSNLEQSLEFSKKSLKMRKDLNDKKLIARSLIDIAGVYSTMGNLDLVLEHGKKVLDIEDVNIPSKMWALRYIGNTYRKKGELSKGLEYLKQGLNLAKEIDSSVYIADVVMRIGMIYRMQGDLENAKKCLERSFQVSEKVGVKNETSGILLYLIMIYLDMGSLDRAQKCLHNLKQFSEEHQNIWAQDDYRIAKALTLKSTKGKLEKEEAKNLLKLVIYKKSAHHTNINFALVILCELLIDDLIDTDDFGIEFGILDEIDDLIIKLVKIAEEQGSFRWLAETNLLKSKISLIRMDLGEARRFLTQAQRIADEHDLQNIARKISREHDKLLDQLKLWNDFKNKRTNAAERIKLASLDETMEHISGKRELDTPKSEIERPILLTIMTNGGLSIFTKFFSKNSELNDDLLSGFLNAINSLGTEIFSESIDRIAFKEHKILFKIVEPLMLCYIINGQSYPAQKKLEFFSNSVRNTNGIWESLNSAVTTCGVVTIDDNQLLKDLIKEIFIS